MEGTPVVPAIEPLYYQFSFSTDYPKVDSNGMSKFWDNPFYSKFTSRGMSLSKRSLEHMPGIGTALRGLLWETWPRWGMNPKKFVNPALWPLPGE